MCGPDVTDALAESLAKSYETLDENLPEGPQRPGGIRERELRSWVGNKKPMDWKNNWLSNPEVPGCPTGDECSKTVTLCGICFPNDVPGNINFAYAGLARYSHFELEILSEIAQRVATTGSGYYSEWDAALSLLYDWETYDDEQDSAAMDVGNDIYGSIAAENARGAVPGMQFAPASLIRDRLHRGMGDPAKVRKHLCAAVHKKAADMSPRTDCSPCLHQIRTRPSFEKES